MTLLSPLALLFALAAAVPLLLHLYQRRRKILVLFSTNRFFTRSIVRSQRRLRLRRLLLLTLRMAACVLFALALARPILGLAGLAGAGAGNHDLVVLLDDSLSMQASLAGVQRLGLRDSLSEGAMPEPVPSTAREAPSERSESRGDGHAPGATNELVSENQSYFASRPNMPVGHKRPWPPGMAPSTRVEGSDGQNSVLNPGDSGLRTQDSGLRTTRLDLAKATTCEILNSLTRGDRAAVVTFSGRTLGFETRGGIELTPDVPRLVEWVQRLKAIPAAGDASAGLKQAAEFFKGGAARARSLLILTDMQAGDWGQADWPQPEAPVRTVLARLAPPTRDNVLVDQVMLSQGTAVAGQPNLLRVRLVNHRPRVAQAQLVLHVDGKEVSRRQVEPPGGSPLIERIPLVFDRPGVHSLVASIDAADALAADNTFYATVQVNPRLPVLLVGGDVETAREKPAAFYLQAALQAVSEDPTVDSIPVQTVAPADVSSVRLDRCRVVILSNVPDLPIAQVDQLEQFVRTGGGLAILLGDRCETKFYNEVLGAPSRPLGGLLPAEIRSRLGAEGAGQPMHIVEAEMDHPLFARFKGTLRGALAGISIYQAYGVSPRDSWTLASVDGLVPLIVERRYGQGRVILVGTVPKPSWTDWPVRRAFIPLASSLVSYLAGGASVVADKAACQDLILGTAVRSVELPPKVRRPDGSLVVTQVRLAGVQAAAYVPADLADQAGLYGVEPAAGSASGELIAVNTSRRESSPDVLDPEEAVRLAGRWQPTIVDLSGSSANSDGSSVSSLTSALSTSPGSTGIWNTLLWAVLAIVAIEPLIANRNPQGRDPAKTAEGIDERRSIASGND